MLEISSDSSFTVVYSFTKKQDSDSLTTCTIDSTLHENSKYWWRVKASDYFEESNFSPLRAFYVNTVNSSPNTFSLSSPVNESTPHIGSVHPTFFWTPSSDPDPLDSVKYAITIARNSGFNGAETASGLVTNFYALDTNLSWSTQYWWKVKAYDLNGGVTWSIDTFTFITMTLGSADSNVIVNVSDAVFLINYIFAGGPAPNPLLEGDANCDGKVNISDAVYLIAYIFAGGPPPCSP
jgi:hypothetical protein